MGFIGLFWLSVLSACHHDPGFAYVAPSDQHIAYTGRFDTRDKAAVRFAWSGSRIDARFHGSFVRAVLTQTRVEPTQQDDNRVEVTIDDDASRTFVITPGTHLYPFADKLGPGVHRIAITKLTEAGLGTISFHGFHLEEGQALDTLPALPLRRLEFVGDSITAGYGNQGEDSSCGFSARTENADATYAAFAARRLNASYTSIAWSGKGLLRNNDGSQTLTMAELYPLNIPTDTSSTAIAVPAPDAVIVNLGTNDAFSGPIDNTRFGQAYLQLLQTLRKRYPKALLVTAIGPMLADDFPRPNVRTQIHSVFESVHNYLAQTKDQNTALIDLWGDPTEGLGCNAHPNIRTHQRLGGELAQLLAQRLRWQ